MTRTKREFFRTPEYFETQIDNRRRNLERLNNLVRTPAKLPKHLDQWLRGQLELLICRYSMGTDRDELTAQFHFITSLLLAEEQVHPLPLFELENQENYYFVLSLFSLALLLQTDRTTFAALAKLLEDQRPKKPGDLLLDHLIATVLPHRPIAEHALHPKAYAGLIRALGRRDNNARVNDVLAFLSDYYINMESLSWHGSQYRNADNYIGLWSFALAALVRHWDLDDAMFSLNMFYPRDLVNKTSLQEDREAQAAERKAAFSKAVPAA